MYIAYRQWQTDAARAKSEMFHRRFEIYEAAEALRARTENENVDADDIQQFHSVVRKARFLMGEDMRKYLEEHILDRAAEMRRFKFQALPSEALLEKVVHERDTLDDEFAKYLVPFGRPWWKRSRHVN